MLLTLGTEFYTKNRRLQRVDRPSNRNYSFQSMKFYDAKSGRSPGVADIFQLAAASRTPSTVYHTAIPNAVRETKKSECELLERVPTMAMQ